MDNPVFILWLPIIIISVLSIMRMLKTGGKDGKPWIRIEKVEDNE